MSSLSFIEKEVFESILSMSEGYVLDFTDRTFDTFFMDTVGINIRENYYAQLGTSKAKRLRFFWDNHDDQTVGTILKALIQYVEFKFDSVPTRQIESAKSIVKRLLKEVEQVDSLTEDDFLKKDFGELDISHIPMESIFNVVMKERITELTQCMNHHIPLASIFHGGSILEGLLLGIAQNEPKLFNTANGAPKDSRTGKIRQFHEWSLSQLIDVSTEVGILTPDIKKFSHGLRDFRNYIHPYEQVSNNFQPDNHTSEICHQVLKAAIQRVKQYYSIKGLK